MFLYRISTVDLGRGSRCQCGVKKQTNKKKKQLQKQELFKCLYKDVSIVFKQIEINVNLSFNMLGKHISRQRKFWAKLCGQFLPVAA